MLSNSTKIFFGRPFLPAYIIFRPHWPLPLALIASLVAFLKFLAIENMPRIAVKLCSHLLKFDLTMSMVSIVL